VNERISPAEVERRTEGAVERELALWRAARTEDAVDATRITRGVLEGPVGGYTAVVTSSGAELARAAL
jgi:hypothetical protein